MRATTIKLQELYTQGEKEQIKNFIRFVLSNTSNVKYTLDMGYKLIRDGARFNMSGYGEKVTTENLNILNRFDYVGIYDYTRFLTVDFYKGQGVIIYQYWPDGLLGHHHVSGETTTDIIYNVLELTIFSGNETRRRE